MKTHNEEKCRRIMFCSKCSKCPVVEITDESVTIGEEGNKVRLTPGQFDDLKKAIKAGKM